MLQISAVLEKHIEVCVCDFSPFLPIHSFMVMIVLGFFLV